MKSSADAMGPVFWKRAVRRDPASFPRNLSEDWRQFASFAGKLRRAFSLLEVLIAVGIFATGVATVLALLPALTRRAAVSADTLAALSLTDAIRTELRRVAAAGGLDALAAQTKPLAAPLPETLSLVATRDAGRLHSVGYEPPVASELIPVAGQYFVVEVWRFSDAPLAIDPTGAGLALHARVSWPFHVPGANFATPLSEREQVGFNLAISR